MATMSPANILCFGFRKCGIYPFNPYAIDFTISTNNPAGQVQGVAGDEKEQLIQVRYKEGYNLYDEEYLQWLSIHHPDAITQDSDAPEAPPDLSEFGSVDDLATVPG